MSSLSDCREFKQNLRKILTFSKEKLNKNLSEILGKLEENIKKNTDAERIYVVFMRTRLTIRGSSFFRARERLTSTITGGLTGRSGCAVRA